MNKRGPSFYLEWFKIGQTIPFGSKFIKSQHMLNDMNVVVEMYLYEVICRA